MVKIANDTRDFLKIDNVNFYTSSFEEFEPKRKYDFVFSLANDETVDGLTKFTFTEYIQKIADLSASRDSPRHRRLCPARIYGHTRGRRS